MSGLDLHSPVTFHVNECNGDLSPTTTWFSNGRPVANNRLKLVCFALFVFSHSRSESLAFTIVNFLIERTHVLGVVYCDSGGLI